MEFDFSEQDRAYREELRAFLGLEAFPCEHADDTDVNPQQVLARIDAADACLDTRHISS